MAMPTALRDGAIVASCRAQTLMKLLYYTLLAALLLACGQSPEPPATAGAAHHTVVSVPVQAGNWLVINYWATWCLPCRQEIPQLNAFAAEHAGAAIVYGVNYDAVRDEALRVQATELGIKFPLLDTDPAQQLGYARPTVLPTTIVINPAGALIARLQGPQTALSVAATMRASAYPGTGQRRKP